MSRLGQKWKKKTSDEILCLIKSRSDIVSNGCWLWKMGKDKDGYGKVTIDYKCYRSHRVAFECVNGKIQAGAMACHKCDNPSCCNPDHIFLGTQMENITDSVAKGHHIRGSRCHLAKLSDCDIREVFDLHRSGRFDQGQIADIYCVSQASMSCILLRKTWRRVELYSWNNGDLK